MAFELMEMLVQFLCPTSNAASQCQSFISSHSSIAPPMGQYIYFLFFPTVFLLLFLWIVFKDAVKANKGISLIATIAVYIFIIIQGLYPIFLALGELWIIFIFILGFFYIIIRRFRKDSGGGKSGKMTANMGMAQIAKEMAFGKRELNPAIRKLKGKELGDKIKELEAYMKTLSSSEERKGVAEQISALKADRKELEKRKNMGLYE